MVSSLSDSSQQHTFHINFFHVIFISAYSAGQVKIYAYVDIPGRNDLITELTRKMVPITGRARSFLLVLKTK